MAAVNIGIGHDNDFMIPQFFDIQRLAVFFGTDGDPKGGKDIFYLLVFKDLVLHGFFHVQDFSFQGKDRLEVTVAALFCRSACGITLNDKYFRFGRVFIGTVGQFTRQAGS